MAYYILLALIAAVVQIASVYLLRVGILTSFMWALPFILIHQYLFLYNYTQAPNFTLIWFITTAITSILSFLLGYVVLKEPVSSYQLAGIALIVIGVIFLRL